MNKPVANTELLAQTKEQVPEHPEGWELTTLPRADKKGYRKHTGKRTLKMVRRRQAIIDALAAGAPITWICKAFNAHAYTVAAIAKEMPYAVESGKAVLGKLCMKIAGVAANSYLDKLASNEINPNQLPIHSAIFADKGLLLLGQATSIQEHRRAADVVPDRVNGFWDRGTVVEAEVVTSDGATSALSSEPKQLEAPAAADTALATATPTAQAPGAPLEVGPESAAGATPAAPDAPTPDPRGGEGVEPAPRSTDG